MDYILADLPVNSHTMHTVMKKLHPDPALQGPNRPGDQFELNLFYIVAKSSDFCRSLSIQVN